MTLKTALPVVLKTKLFSLFSKNMLLAGLTGVLLTASFPPLELSFLAWIALVPLFISLSHASPSSAFRLGLTAGIIHYLTLIYWITVVLGRYGGLNLFMSSFPCLLLCVYLALYPAFFAYMITVLDKSYFHILLTACLWVGLEYIRTRYPAGGFPWCLLGYSQYKNLHLIQISDIFGVYGLSFLIIIVNGLVFRLMRLFKTMNNAHGAAACLKWEMLMILLMVGGTFFYGRYRLLENQSINKDAQTIRTLIVQGNIDQVIKWDPEFQTQTLDTYIKLTRGALDSRPKLVVWPETAVPFFFQDHAALSPLLVSMVKESGVTLLFGSPAYKRDSGGVHYYNRAYMIPSEDKSIQYYDKVHLVPFGEYVPFKKFLWFINRMVPAAGDFAEGDAVVTLNTEDLSIGVLICFEAIFPDISRIHSMNGANILINITNDAWFGNTSAPYQHLAMAVFRAVENKRPLIRSANTGFSAYIGPYGNIIQKGRLFSEETLLACPRVSNSPATFYTRFGDVFAVSTLAISLMVGSAMLWKKRAQKNQLNNN